MRHAPARRWFADLAIRFAAWCLRRAFSVFLYLYERSERRREYQRERRMLRYRGAP